MRVTMIDHPLAHDRLAVLRDRTTGIGLLRTVLDELSVFLIYEAVREMPVQEVTVQTPVGSAACVRIRQQPVIVPILRGGLGMANAATRLFPEAGTGFVGLARHPVTQEPELYLNSLPSSLADRTALVLDPMLASGRSVEVCCRLLAERGCAEIVVVSAIAAQEGIDYLGQTDLPIRLVTAAIDGSLNVDGYVIPGMGDAGDRQFDADYATAVAA